LVFPNVYLENSTSKSDAEILMKHKI
jgi:hypothetical protein